MNHDEHPSRKPHEPDERPDNAPCDGPGVELGDGARQAEDALRRIAHLTLDRSTLTPAEVDTVLGHLAETVAALPQIAAQLGDILDRARDTHQLATDARTATTDPDLAVDTARLHLDEIHTPAVQTYQRLNVARNETAHIAAAPLTDDFDPAVVPQDRQSRRLPLQRHRGLRERALHRARSNRCADRQHGLTSETHDARSAVRKTPRLLP